MPFSPLPKNLPPTYKGHILLGFSRYRITIAGKQRSCEINLSLYRSQNLFHISESHDTDCKARILILMVA